LPQKSEDKMDKIKIKTKMKFLNDVIFSFKKFDKNFFIENLEDNFLIKFLKIKINSKTIKNTQNIECGRNKFYF
jgi:hypothetical protein